MGYSIPRNRICHDVTELIACLTLPVLWANSADNKLMIFFPKCRLLTILPIMLSVNAYGGWIHPVDIVTSYWRKHYMPPYKNC